MEEALDLSSDRIMSDGPDDEKNYLYPTDIVKFSHNFAAYIKI